MTGKVLPLAAAIEAHVHPGDTVHVAYSDARPNAALMQLVRRFAGSRPGLTLTTAGLVSVQHALVELGIVDRVEASFAGENFPAARPNPAFQRAHAEGRVTVANWSLWSLVARLVAGALGVPWHPVRSLAGSGLADEHRGTAYADVLDPFGGPPTGIVAALNPDVVLLHGVAADRAGNVVLAAPYGEGAWGALAARRGVVATVEKIVEPDAIRAHNTLVRVPAHTVLSVSEVPYGAHPYGLYNPGFPGVAGYVEDHELMTEVTAAARTAEGFRAWIDERILGVDDHAGWLRRLGSDRLAALTGGAAPDQWRHDDAVPVSAADVPPSPTEVQVVAAARRVAERVVAGGFQTVLAGVGLANLASWSAVRRLGDDGCDVALTAEIGMVGYDPRPGEPFIFAHRNLPTCTLLGDVAGVLGTLVAGPGTRCLGVLGAGEVDAQGRTNSTYTRDGTFLVGSGGANDIASAADEVLLTVAHRRLVREVGYVTCPGERVGSVVTSAGVFARDGDGFVLVRYLPRAGLDARGAVEAMRAESDWPFTVARDLTAEPAVAPDELARLRAYDPRGTFLRTTGARR